MIKSDSNLFSTFEEDTANDEAEDEQRQSHPETSTNEEIK